MGQNGLEEATKWTGHEKEMEREKQTYEQIKKSEWEGFEGGEE